MATTSAFPHAAAIEASLERLAERSPDPTAHIYALLFARQPHMEVHFWRDKNGAIRGQMLAKTFEAILDFVGPRRYAAMMIQNELITHEGYDIPREVFATFFGVVRDGVRELLAEIDGYIAATAPVAESNPYFKKLAADFEAQGAGPTAS